MKQNSKKEKKAKKKMVTWKKVLLFIFLLFVILIIGIRLNNRYNRGPTGQEAAVGETLRVGHTSYTVNDVEVVETIWMDGEDRGVTDGVFLILDMTVRNHQFSGTLFFYPSISFQTDGEYYPPADEDLGIAQAAAEERGAYAFERYENIGRRETLEGILVFLVSQEWLDADDAALYFYSTQWWGEQDGYMYFE